MHSGNPVSQWMRGAWLGEGILHIRMPAGKIWYVSSITPNITKLKSMRQMPSSVKVKRAIQEISDFNFFYVSLFLCERERDASIIDGVVTPS